MFMTCHRSIYAGYDVRVHWSRSLFVKHHVKLSLSGFFHISYSKALYHIGGL